MVLDSLARAAALAKLPKGSWNVSRIEDLPEQLDVRALGSAELRAWPAVLIVVGQPKGEQVMLWWRTTALGRTDWPWHAYSCLFSVLIFGWCHARLACVLCTKG